MCKISSTPAECFPASFATGLDFSSFSLAWVSEDFLESVVLAELETAEEFDPTWAFWAGELHISKDPRMAPIVTPLDDRRFIISVAPLVSVPSAHKTKELLYIQKLTPDARMSMAASPGQFALIPVKNACWHRVGGVAGCERCTTIQQMNGRTGSG
jgi:hypothetical protein